MSDFAFEKQVRDEFGDKTKVTVLDLVDEVSVLVQAVERRTLTGEEIRATMQFTAKQARQLAKALRKAAKTAEEASGKFHTFQAITERLDG